MLSPLQIITSLTAVLLPTVTSQGASPALPYPPVVDQPAPTSLPVMAGAGGHRKLTIQRSTDGLFYVEAMVNGASVHFVVDSGSSVVVLSAGDAARSAVGGSEPMSVDTAGGASPMRRARIKQVMLAGNLLSNVDAAIVDRDLKVSLLGQSALSKLSSVTFKGDQLEFE